LGQFGIWASVIGLCLGASAATDPFLQLSLPSFTNGLVQFTLTGERGVSYVVESSTDLANWSRVQTNCNNEIIRLISLEASNRPTCFRAWRKGPLYWAGLAAKFDITLKGNTIVFDSYDSSDPTHDDPLDLQEVKPGGNLASQEGLIDVGNATIKGKVLCGPTSTYVLGPNGSVGDLAWVGNGSVQPGWARTNFVAAYPDVSPPYISGLPPASGAGTNYWMLGSGDYFIAGDVSLAGKVILVLGNARLFVTGDFLLSDASEIKIEASALLRLYVAGGRTLLPAVRASDFAPAFQYYGLPGNTNCTWPGSGEQLIGTIYAPSTVFVAGDEGISTNHFFGACVVNEAVLKGRFSFHCDENLFKRGP
jgi:hypothetical protein